MQLFIPESPDALLTRDATAAALTAAGFPVATRTLGRFCKGIYSQSRIMPTVTMAR